MNRQQFNEALEKLRQAPGKAQVLRLVLTGHTNAEIARLRKRAEGTVRKQISQLYQDFAIESEFPGDQALRDKLKALFRKYKPEWVSDCHSAVTNEVSEEQERLNPDSLPHLVSSSAKRGESLIALAARMLHQFDFSPLHLSSTRAVEGEEDLMSLATQMLEQFGFNRKFKVSRAFQHVGYRLKNAKKEVNPHQLILSQRKDGLCISIRKDILDPHLLNLKYWEYTDVLAEADLFTKARFLVLPSKKDIFLESLHPNYWNSLQAEEKTVGDSELNTCTLVELDDYFWEEAQGFAPRPPMCEAVPSFVLDEFNPDTLSDRDTYLVVNDDKLFPGTWQVFISSREVLKEFLSHFAKMLCVDVELEREVTHLYEGRENLMPVATKMLERFGFERELNLSGSSIHIRYQLKIPKNGSNLYQLVLVQRKEGLSIYIPKNILEKTLLYLMYYVNYDGFEIAHSVAGIFWVLPSKKEIFLESLHSNYWSVLKGQTEGSFYLNDVDDDGYGSGPVIPSSLLDEFSPNTLSNTSSYLVLSEDQRFPDTWQVCICSLEVLEEFIGHLADQILMAN